MGRVADQRRKEFFEALAERDAQRGRVDTARAKAAVKVVEDPRAKECCVRKFAGRIPDNFTACADCPIDSTS